MKKSDIRILPEHFDQYITLVVEEELVISLQNTLKIEQIIDISLLNKKADYSYAPGKWSVKDVLQHLIDAERVLSYRALCFARNDQTELPGFDESQYGEHMMANWRTIDDLLIEMKVVRNATILLFKNFNDEMLLRKGICYKVKIDVLSLGFAIIGHQKHHFNIIKSKYFC